MLRSMQGLRVMTTRGIPLSAVWVLAAIALPAFVAISLPLSSVDLAYLLSAGDRLLGTGSVPRTEPFLAWSLGRPWLNQQWGAELLFGLVFRAGGWFGLALLRAVLAAVFLGSTYLACHATQFDRRRAALLALGAGALTVGLMGLRSQLVGMACFAASLWLVEGRRLHPGRLWWALPIQVLWANTHGSFPLGPVLLGFAVIEDRLERRPDVGRTLQVAALSLGATLLGPFGPDVWRYAVRVATHPQVRNVVVEWRPATLRTVPGALFLLSGLAVAAFLARRGEPAHPLGLVRLGLFFLLGLTAIRGIAWWGPIAAVEVARLLPRTPRDGLPRPDPVTPVNTALAGVLLLLLVGALARWTPYTNERAPGDLLTYAPQGITRTLEDLLEPGERFFHAQAWGSWFELALPENPTTVDARFEVMPPRRWREYEAVSHGRADWEEILEDWGVRVLALSREQQEELIPIVLRDPDWRLVYEDEEGLVLVRA
jgi:hypothetical protein